MSASEDSSEDEYNYSYADDLFFTSTEQLQQASHMLFMGLESTKTRKFLMTENKRKRRKHGAVFYMTEDGVTKVLPVTASTWYRTYVKYPALDSEIFHKKFRRRFRLPYQQFLEVVEGCKNSDLFARWNNTDATGKPSVPLELLVLTALRYLGRGWTFDDLSESTGISEEVVRKFFHKFIEYGSTTLFERYVVAPKTPEDAKQHNYEFEMAGLPGAIGSMDATHVAIEKVAYNRRQSHLGFKNHSTARTYNIVVNHRRRILGTTNGHPARWNDKTIVRFDEIAMGLKSGNVLDNFTFELYDFNSNDEIIKVKYRGPWLIVDNGYHMWSVTIPPFKTTTSRKEIRFSEWIESIRKDVECTFGILKGRWRILKTGIRLRGLRKADQIWKTCCALHNYLLEIDGLDSKWDWTGELGEHEERDIRNVPALSRLNNLAAARKYDSSGMGHGNDRIEDNNVVDDSIMIEGHEDISEIRTDELNDNYIRVRNLSFNEFRKKLVNHFEIAFQKGEVKWPTCNSNKN